MPGNEDETLESAATLIRKAHGIASEIRLKKESLDSAIKTAVEKKLSTVFNAYSAEDIFKIVTIDKTKAFLLFTANAIRKELPDNIQAPADDKIILSKASDAVKESPFFEAFSKIMTEAEIATLITDDHGCAEKDKSEELGLIVSELDSVGSDTSDKRYKSFPGVSLRIVI